MGETAEQTQRTQAVDEQEVLADVRRRTLRRSAVAAAAWTVGAALVAAVDISRGVVGPGALPADAILLVASIVGLFGVAALTWSRLTSWEGEIETMDGRLERWRAERKLRRTQLGLVLLFGFLAGMVLWEIQFEAWGLVFLLLGYPLSLYAGYRTWDDFDDDTGQIAIVGWATAGLYPFVILVLPSVAAGFAVGGFALVAAAFGLAAAEVEADDEDRTGDQAEPSR